MFRLLLAICIFCTLPVNAHNEAWYVDKYCSGITEYVLPNKTRVDCYTSEFVAEYDWAKKYRQCIGQALEYSMNTGKPAKCVLIRKSEYDCKYINRAKKLIEYYSLPVEVQVIE